MAAWNEWRERCAGALCSPEAQTILHTFGGMRFRTLAQRCLPLVNLTDASALAISDSDAWHLLEVHMTLPDAINGKAYKQWLFARLAGSADAPFDVVQGGATLLMRSVVREHLRSEYLPADHLSLNQPLSQQQEDAITLGDLLPGDSASESQVALRELAALAASEAQDQFGALPQRARLALSARHQRIPLSDPELLRKAGCSGSVLHGAYRQTAVATFDRLRERYPRDDLDTLRELALLTFEALTQLCLTCSAPDAVNRELACDTTPSEELCV